MHTPMPMRARNAHPLACLVLAAVAFWVPAGPARAQQPATEGRVISSTPIVQNGQAAGYSVTYEYAGRRYATRTPQPPAGPTMPVQVNAYGVTTYPVAPQPALTAEAAGPTAPNGPQVMPEPGVVVSGAGVPYGVAATDYAAPVYPAPVYVVPGYAYPYVSMYPPVGLSFSLGYSRGWHRGWR